MAIEYPDAMNDITDARQRFESGAVQYLAEFPTHPTPAGDVAVLSLALQSVMDVPVQVAIRLDLPQPKGRLKRLPQPFFRILEPEISLTLDNAEAAQLKIPVHIQPYYRDKYGYEPGDFPVAYTNYLRLVTLPLNLRMTDSDIEDVLAAVADVIEKNRR